MVYFAWQLSSDDDQETAGAAATQASGGVPALRLLSERTAAPDTETSTATKEAIKPSLIQAEKKNRPVFDRPEAQRKQNTSTACHKTGPFPDEQQAQAFAASLQPSPAQAEIQAESAKRRIGFWVKWPEEVTLAGARSVMGELRNRGVSDMSIVPLDNKHYAISLGIFGTRYYMEQRVDEMRALGYTPIVEGRYKQVTRYWLIVQDMDASGIARMRSQVAQMQGIALQSTDCGSVAFADGLK